MRAVHVIKVTGVAGAERHLLTLLPALHQAGIEVHLALLTEPDKPMTDFARMMESSGIRVHPFTIQRDLAPGLIGQLHGLFRHLRPDLVHTHLLHADLYGIPAARLARVPVILTSRHNDNAFRRRFPVRQVNRALWGMADAGIAISDSIARFAVEVEGAPAQKIHRIYYGLNFKPPLDRGQAGAALRGELNLPADTPLVGIVCRLVAQKGVSYGLQAIERAADLSGAHLVIAGDGPLRAELESQAQAAGLAGRVHFLGWRGDIPALMAAFDIFLLPSLWEGFGLVLLEAMAQQTPVIASTVSAIPEIVADGETGLLVPPRDVDGLAQALTHLLHDPAFARHLGLLGRERAENHFSAARMADETLQLYRRLCG
ncbi:MAG: glycosyltransferase [Anaerolineae bacterium]|nr:glycosyltransferase [Anaerolineae bacterium]